MSPDNNSLEQYAHAWIHRPGHTDPLPIPTEDEVRPDLIRGLVNAVGITLFFVAVVVALFALTSQLITWRGI